MYISTTELTTLYHDCYILLNIWLPWCRYNGLPSYSILLCLYIWGRAQHHRVKNWAHAGFSFRGKSLALSQACRWQFNMWPGGFAFLWYHIPQGCPSTWDMSLSGNISTNCCLAHTHLTFRIALQCDISKQWNLLLINSVLYIHAWMCEVLTQIHISMHPHVYM